MSNDVKEGTVKWYNFQRGYGFISSDAGDVFFHHSALPGKEFRNMVYTGDIVTYMEGKSDNGKLRTSSILSVIRKGLMADV